MKKLIIHADDFGLSERTNLGILQLLEKRIVTSTSILSNAQSLEHGVREGGDYDLGVHLAATLGRPLSSQTSTLTDTDGFFCDFSTFVGRYLRGRLSYHELYQEWSMQIERVLDHGVAPSHLDSHHHVHCLPKVRAIVEELAMRYGIRSVRSLQPKLEWSFFSRKEIILAGLSLFAAQNERLVTADSILGVGLRLKKGNNPFLGLVRRDWEGVAELVCHPGLLDTSLHALDVYVEDRFREYEFLSSAEFCEHLQDIELISYTDLQR